jgi:hypothetical protein
VLQALLSLVLRHQVGFAIIESVAIVKSHMAAVGYDLLGQNEGWMILRRPLPNAACPIDRALRFGVPCMTQR